MCTIYYTLYVSTRSFWSRTGPIPTDDEKQHVFDTIANELSRKLIELASRRARTERLAEWRQVFDESGAGSTYRRANVIAEWVYHRAAPIPDVTPSLIGMGSWRM
jgi:hypothetical protein